MAIKNCISIAKDSSENFKYTFACRVCKKSFKKFVFFEGHFTFNAECRKKNGSFVQCYVCGVKFYHLADLKYHIRLHSISKPSKSKGPKGRPKQLVKKRNSHKCNVDGTSINEKRILANHGQANTGMRDKLIHPDLSNRTRKKKKMAQCKICKKKFNCNYDLATHETIHAGDFECDICHIYFTKAGLAKHRSCFHPGQLITYPCQICGKKFVSRRDLAIHETVHAGDFECDICHIYFTKAGLAKHRSCFHPGQLITYPCQICGKKFVSRRDLARHEPIHEGNQKCEICQITFTMRAFVRHTRQCHTSDSNIIVAEVKYDENKCKICNSSFNSNSRLVRHEQVHIGVGLKDCDICKIPFTRLAMINHTKQYHPDRTQNVLKPKTCNICNRSFKFHSRLVKHQIIHAKGTVRCEMCDITFTKRALFTHNKQYHQNQQRRSKIRCKFCRSWFARLAVKSHQMLCGHNKENQSDPLEPSISEETLTRNDLQCHSNDQSFECYVCKSDFQSTRNLRIHMKKHLVGEQ